MKKLTLLLALALALSWIPGCAAGTDREDGFRLYYVRENREALDTALDSILWEGTREAEAVFAALRTAPAEEGLTTYIPQGTTLQSAQLSDGILYLDLSGEYGTLTGIDLTMASYCITLTMCQLEGVTGVAITADQEYLMEDTILTPRQVMLDGGQGDTSTLEVTLYFPREDGSGIGWEQRELTISENRSEAESILDALCAGPESRELSAYLPTADQGITLWSKEGICYVNLTESWRQALEADPEALADKLWCIAASLTQLDEVEAVQLLMDGAALESWAAVGGDLPISPDTGGLTAAEN